jgi:WhiB family redox-sensing transcriptional regulator
MTNQITATGEPVRGRAPKLLTPQFLDDTPDVVPCAAEPDVFFVRDDPDHVARRLCRHCPVRDACLAFALRNREEFGVWGGLTHRGRRALLRQGSDGLVAA